MFNLGVYSRYLTLGCSWKFENCDLSSSTKAVEIKQIHLLQKCSHLPSLASGNLEICIGCSQSELRWLCRLCAFTPIPVALHRPVEDFCSLKAIPFCHIKKKKICCFFTGSRTLKRHGERGKDMKNNTIFHEQFCIAFHIWLLLDIVLCVQSTNPCCEICQRALMKNLRTQFKGWFETAVQVCLKNALKVYLHHINNKPCTLLFSDYIHLWLYTDSRAINLNFLLQQLKFLWSET